MSQLAQYLNANILVLSKMFAEGFYQANAEGVHRLTSLSSGDEIVFNKTDKTFSIGRMSLSDTSIYWLGGDDKFWLGSNQTEDFLIVARFIGLLYKLRVKVVESDASRVFARFV